MKQICPHRMCCILFFNVFHAQAIENTKHHTFNPGDYSAPTFPSVSDEKETQIAEHCATRCHENPKRDIQYAC